MLNRFLQFYDRFMHQRYARPRGRSLYIYTAESPMYAVRYMFAQWIARCFPPTWIYEVWQRPSSLGTDGVGGDTYGYFLHLSDAERVVNRLRVDGMIAGWTQHSLMNNHF